jgi:membrane fusion protein, multidrug efflux system
VTAATRVATLQRLDRLKVDFSVPEKYVTRLRVGSPIQLTVAGAERRFAGAIYAIDPRIDSATRTVLIRAACPNKEASLFPGAFASVSLTLGEIDNAVLVPAIAVVPGLNAKTVFVVEDGKAQLRTVVTGTRLEDRVQILEGLKPGEVVVTSGVLQLSPGQKVHALVAGQSAGAT